MSENIPPLQVKTTIAGITTPVEKAKPENATPLVGQIIKNSLKLDDKARSSKFTRYSMDPESLKDAYYASPYVWKFFLMIYRLSPTRTIIIIAVFIIQGLLPALRLRTGADFIHHVESIRGFGLPIVTRWDTIRKLKLQKPHPSRDYTSYNVHS